MKVYGEFFQAHLAGDTTRLSYCWRITRRDGVVLGFTDHDEDVICDGTTFLATTGITTTKVVRRLGLSVDNLQLEGAIDDDALTETDIERGLYDDAAVDLLIVNWGNTGQFDTIARGTFGNANVTETGFEVEFRSRSHVLNQPTGRVFQRTCDAKLGDGRCRVNLATADHTVTATVAAAGGDVVVLASIAQAADWFSLGKLIDADGGEHGIKNHDGNTLTLWEVPVVLPEVGSEVTLIVGCRQDMETCRVKFDNILNFQGMPHIPGNDRLAQYPTQGLEAYDGGSLFS